MSITKIMIFVFTGTVVLSLTPTQAQAHGGWFHKRHHHKKYHHSKHHHNKHYHYKSYHRKRHHDHHHNYGKVVFRWPDKGIKLVVRGKKYHYHDGRYYRRKPYGYYEVDAPIGACVAKLPYGYHTVYIDGHQYYVYNGVYYKKTYEGYVVVDKPHYYYASHKPNKHKHLAKQVEGSFELNIPTKDGGYVSVKIQRKDKGFVGPQGEYYDEFPEVAQLQVMYGQ